jgi:hypothetical protein
VQHGPRNVDDGPERRRRWGSEDRRQIFMAAFAPGAIVADVSRQFEVSTSLIYKWRREVLATQTEGQFCPGGDCRWAAGRGVRSSVGAGDRGRAGQRRPGDDRCDGNGLDGERGASGAAMIPISSGVRVWIASGHTDTRE